MGLFRRRTDDTAKVPSGRFGEAIEQAKSVLFLASDDSSYITVSYDILSGKGRPLNYLSICREATSRWTEVSPTAMS